MFFPVFLVVFLREGSSAISYSAITTWEILFDIFKKLYNCHFENTSTIRIMAQYNLVPAIIRMYNSVLMGGQGNFQSGIDT